MVRLHTVALGSAQRIKVPHTGLCALSFISQAYAGYRKRDGFSHGTAGDSGNVLSRLATVVELGWVTSNLRRDGQGPSMRR